MLILFPDSLPLTELLTAADDLAAALALAGADAVANLAVVIAPMHAGQRALMVDKAGLPIDQITVGRSPAGNQGAERMTVRGALSGGRLQGIQFDIADAMGELGGIAAQRLNLEDTHISRSSSFQDLASRVADGTDRGHFVGWPTEVADTPARETRRWLRLIELITALGSSPNGPVGDEALRWLDTPHPDLGRTPFAATASLEGFGNAMAIVTMTGGHPIEPGSAAASRFGDLAASRRCIGAALEGSRSLPARVCYALLAGGRSIVETTVDFACRIVAPPDQSLYHLTRAPRPSTSDISELLKNELMIDSNVVDSCIHGEHLPSLN